MSLLIQLEDLGYSYDTFNIKNYNLYQVKFAKRILHSCLMIKLFYHGFKYPSQIHKQLINIESNINKIFQVNDAEKIFGMLYIYLYHTLKLGNATIYHILEILNNNDSLNRFIDYYQPLQLNFTETKSKFADTIREKLNLNLYPKLNQISDILISIAFREYSQFENKSNLFEMLGDSVLEIIITDILFPHLTNNDHKNTQMRFQLVKNTTLFCFMNRLNLCNDTIVKNCADYFESLLGVMWFDLNQKDLNVIFHIKEWLESDKIFSNYIQNTIETGTADVYCNTIAKDDSIQKFKDFDLIDFYIRKNPNSEIAIQQKKKRGT